MPDKRRKVRIDKAAYLVAGGTRTYSFLGINPLWKEHVRSENEENKKSIDGYTRIFRNGKKKIFTHSIT